jgi:hypothetical protein
MLGFFSIALMPIPLLLYWYGKKRAAAQKIVESTVEEEKV